MSTAYDLLVDPDPPTTFEGIDKLTQQALRFIMAVVRYPQIAEALRRARYDVGHHDAGRLLLLHVGTSSGEEQARAVEALHAWVWMQHVRALEAGMKRSHLITLGVVNRRVRPIPEESGIVLKGVRR